MTSILYTSLLEDMARGAVDFDSDAFKVVLVNATYAAIADETKKDSHSKRSHVSAYEVAGTAYSAGGKTALMTVTKDTANNRLDLGLGAASWLSATITAWGAVYYKARGGADTADELVAYIDFGGAIAATAGTFGLQSSLIRFLN